MQIGYLGLGAMGGALARRLQLSRKLVVFDLNPAAVADMVARGADAALSPAELARRCDVVFLCLPTSEHVRTAIFGNEGLIEGLRPGMMIADQTTGDPNVTRAMAERLLEHGVELVDAPVSGGAIGAEAGTIAIMLGATEAQFARLAPIFADISPNLFHAGTVGNGQVIKLVNNLISHSQRLLTQEGMALAVRNGVAPARALEILLAGGARNAYMERILEPRVLKGQLKVGFTLGLAEKDVRLACNLGGSSGVPMPFGALTSGIYRDMVAEKGDGAEVETSGLITEARAGTRFIPDDHSV
jgi:3-hydroxyisobutyrate dehydrogenase